MLGLCIIGLQRSVLTRQTMAHTMRRTKALLIYRRIKNLRAIQLLLGHSKLENTVRYLGIEVDDALEMAEQTEVCVCLWISTLVILLRSTHLTLGRACNCSPTRIEACHLLSGNQLRRAILLNGIPNHLACNLWCYQIAQAANFIKYLFLLWFTSTASGSSWLPICMNLMLIIW